MLFFLKRAACILLFCSMNLSAKNNEIDDFFNLFPEKKHYSVYKKRSDSTQWLYDCKINVDRVANIKKNIKDIDFNKKDSSIRFIFDAPDHPYYKVTSVEKVGKNYIVFFQDKDMGTNFWFEVSFKKNKISSWEFNMSPEFEDDPNFKDFSFEMISFDKKPEINILNKCNQ
jgi:hypothetical protein